MIRTRGLVKRYGDLVAVDRVDLTVPAGDVYGLLGPNGAGKTTFMRMLFGLIRPDEGSVELFGLAGVPGKVDALDDVAGFVETPRFYGYLSGARTSSCWPRSTVAGSTASSTRSSDRSASRTGTRTRCASTPTGWCSGWESPPP